ncbi:hypothetical protein A3L14_10950 [Thermococcus thioreducens]|uniref:Uncharacterized protein n=1 Tax=Thermococcus thioreducens TaxID=277988 RepID=A0A0Q2QT89_9EURY|nr:hypothetical protein A3L14_10950 [Thermococcus thioreducens]KQH83229.1 hypothetical protein AMR53_00660 [Thermococcus thioreducens]
MEPAPEPEIREDIRAELAAKVENKNENRQRFWRLAITFIGSLLGFGLVAYAAPGFYDTLLSIHESLATPRYSFYVLVGSIAFVEFMRMTWVESAKARSKRLIPLTSPETEIWVKEKPLIGLKLPFTNREIKNKRIKPHIVETELGWRVYPNRSLLSPQWNGEIYFIPYDSIHGYGNTRIISARKPSQPTYYETDPITGEAIPVYVWEPIDLGEEKYMRAQKEIAYLQAENRILQEYAARGYELAKTISQIPQEFFEELSNRGFEKAKQILDIMGKGFFSEVGKIKKEEISAILEAIKKDREAW